MREVLQQIGLSGNEADIYLALLELGPSLVSKIVDKTKINRTHIYDRLKKLIDKGLVSHVIKSNRKYFFAAKPKRILRYLEEREEKIKNEKKLVDAILPDLEKIQPASDEEVVEVYEGKEGLKTILEDILRSKNDILTYGSEGNFSKVLKFYFKHYLKKIEKSNIRMKVIFNFDDSKKPFDLTFSEVRYIPKEYKTPTETTIYGDKVAIFLLTNQPKAILIQSKNISKAYQTYFNLLWEIGKKVKS
ncbi:MAG: helix-turn-helix domain-containing protein [Nanoarchaeota archaeon]